jgi:hypothetical protein
VVRDSLLHDRAENYGGAILAAGSTSVSIAGVVEGNVAGWHGGGVAAVSAASIALESGATFRQNIAEGSGGCAFFGGGPVTVGECSCDLCL